LTTFGIFVVRRVGNTARKSHSSWPSSGLAVANQRWALDWIRTIANFVEFGLDPEC